MRRTLWLVALVCGTASAETGRPVTYRKLLDLIGTAQHRVLAYVPYLTDVGLAGALRAASVDPNRQVRVLLLTVPFFGAKEDALSNSLALADAGVVEAQVNSTTAHVLVDDDLFASSQLGRIAGAGDIRLLPLARSNPYVRWFASAVKAGHAVTSYEAFTRIGGTLR